MNRLFETRLLSFQWLPTNLLHFYIYAFFLFEINFIYKHLPSSKQEHMAILTKRSKECKGLFGNYQRTKYYYRLERLFQRENILLVLVKIEGFGCCNN